MITLITGAPGAGKSAALVDLLQSECKRRALYVDGIPEFKLPHVPLDDPRKWPELVEEGAAVVIDEVQRVWRPRGSAAAVPADVAQLETHRHRGLDFYLVTQHPSLLDANVRRLVGRHIHLRDVGLLGRWWYEWPEATNPETFRNAPIKRRYSLPKKAFALYKSASLHVKPIRSIPRAVIVLGLAAAAAVGLAWRAYGSIQSKVAPAPPAAAVQHASPSAAAARNEVAPASLPPAASEPQRPQVVGCFSSANTCRCFDRQGFPVTVEWELCRTSSHSYAGLVPLDLTPAQPAKGASSPSDLGAGG